jgi:GNAT superfamily N-acetyltransferase
VLQDPIQTVDYHQASEALRRDIAVLLHRVWPEVSPFPDELIPDAHEPGWSAQSFYAYAEGHLVSYAGVVQKTIAHQGDTFHIAGLSCVATDPDYRGQGWGFRTVRAATAWMETQHSIDFGIFTCHPSLADFYVRAGAWAVVPDVTLIGSRDEGALSSQTLPVVVLMRLFSPKAQQCQSLRHTTIDLNVPVGQFL